jgi:hypothetical protein
MVSGMVVAGSQEPSSGVSAFREPGPLPRQMKRVAVLPMVLRENTPDYQEGRRVLGSVLFRELARARRFELVEVEPKQLERWTGRRQWAAGERLPQSLFDIVREKTGCDGILFWELTGFHPYAPLVVGLRLQLVDAHEPRFVWSVDEVVDAGDRAVAKDACAYQKARFFEDKSFDDKVFDPDSRRDPRVVLESPTRFAEFVVHRVVSTLPER